MQNETANTNPLPALPKEWPGAWGIYKFSKQAILFNLSTILQLVACFIAIAILDSIAGAVLARTLPAYFVVQVLYYIVAFILNAASIFIFLADIRQQQISLSAVLHKLNVKLVVNFVLMNFLLGIIIGLSLILLIVPFFFVFPRLNLAGYFLLDQNLGPVEAMKASWHATKGNVGKVYGILGATVAMALLAITIIGIPFAIYFVFMYQAAVAILYGFVTKKS